MARLPIEGVIYFPPVRNDRELKRIGIAMQRDYGIPVSCSSAERDFIWDQLGSAIGLGLQEKGAVGQTGEHVEFHENREDVLRSLKLYLKIGKRLRSAREGDIQTIRQIIDGPNTGLTPSLDFNQLRAMSELRSHVARILGLSHHTDTRFPERVRHIRKDPGKHAYVLIAAAEAAVQEIGRFRGSPGRPKLTYYARFTNLLVFLCDRHGFSSKLARNSRTNEPSGALVDLACWLEGFLPKELRSPSLEAMYDRLETGLEQCASACLSKNDENFPM